MHPTLTLSQVFGPILYLTVIGVGLVFGLVTRLLQLHRPTGIGVVSLLIFSAIVTYILAWRGGAYLETGKDLLRQTAPFVTIAAVFSGAIFCGKWLASRAIHSRDNRETVRRLKAGRKEKT